MGGRASTEGALGQGETDHEGAAGGESGSFQEGTTRRVGGSKILGHSGGSVAGRAVDGATDTVVGAAAAQIAVHGGVDVGIRRLRMFL